MPRLKKALKSRWNGRLRLVAVKAATPLTPAPYISRECTFAQ
uniref:Transposase n=1 Tax=Heterorhabditis bacteriophora TaxID=37862 RepID=A0A1I7W886_HETBA